MIRFYSQLSPKLKLYFPILFGIIIAVVIISVYSVNKLQNNIYRSIERNLSMEVNTLVKMFERERDLKHDKVISDLKVTSKLFYQRKLVVDNEFQTIHAINQLTGDSLRCEVFEWRLDGKAIWGDTSFVDEIYSLVGGTSTIFQKIDSGYVRISTNVRKSDGSRAVGTYIPNGSEVIKTIEMGKPFIGRAYVVNDWYITAYEPIYNGDEIVGILYVGGKEKDLGELRQKLAELKIGENGYPFVLDENGKLIIHPFAEGENWKDKEFVIRMLESRTGIESFKRRSDLGKKIVAYDYFEDFGLIIAAAMPQKDEASILQRDVIINSIIIGLVIIVAFSIFVYFVTAENVRNFLSQLELSSKRLKLTEKALEQSEHHFRTLFDNSSDDIFVIDFEGNFIEVNQGACDNLGYSREEFLKMNAREIKPDHRRAEVDSNILMIRKMGQYRYESENQARGGHLIPVEMKSRVIDYKGMQVILTISRDISERKEVEDKILTTIIQTEENERKRFAADLHDDLGPILSTIKLYTDLLKKKNYKNIDEDEAIRHIEELVDMSITSTRTISRNIRPNILQDFGLAAAVNDFCNFIKKTESIHLDVVTDQYTVEERGIEESVLYQAVKELINNTLKHASAKNSIIELKSFGNQVFLSYRDDGSGFDLNEALRQNTGLGLNNIINKIKSVKGTVDIHTNPGEGMFLSATVKLKKEQNNSNGNS